MRCLILLGLLLCANICASNAQTPQFSPPQTGPGNPNMPYPFRASSAGNKIQNIYKSTAFPGAVSGNIVNVYVKAGSTNTGLSTLTNFCIKMGYVTADTFQWVNRAGQNKVVFVTGLDTVLSAASYTFPIATKAGTWIKIPLQKSFAYSASLERNLIVEISQGPDSPKNWFNVYVYGNGNDPLLAIGQRDSAYGQLGQRLLFGFDFASTGIQETRNISGLQLYPNPGDGRFTVAFDAQKSANAARVSVFDVTGKQMLMKHYSNTGNRFSSGLDISGAPKGMYFVKLEADGEVLTQKLIVE